MENEKKYRVHATVNSTWEHKPYLEYAVQRKWLLFWITISEKTKDKAFAQQMCDDLNKTNI
jgi:hypothetical protein